MSFLLACVLATSDPKPASFVVIAPSEIAWTLSSFVEHRRASLPTTLMTLGEICGNEVGVDTPEKIKRRLYREWREQGLRYVLLVGDAATFPVRWMTLDRVHAPAHDVAFYPSDLYYADLARADGSFDDWNASKEGIHARYFGEVHGEHHKTPPMNYDAIDYVPEIAVGRWLVHVGSGVHPYVEGTIALERDPPPSVIAWAVVDGWVDARAGFTAAASRIEAPFCSKTAYFGGDSAPTSARIAALIDERIALLVHAGHGTPDGWEGSIRRADLTAPPVTWEMLKTPDATMRAWPYPDGPVERAPIPRAQILASAGCSTAVIATQPPYEAYVDVDGKLHAGTGAGEVFTDDPPPPAPIQPKEHCVSSFGWAVIERGAAAAYFGCTTGSQPCALTLVEELAAAWPTSARAGDAWITSVTRYVEREKLRELVPTDDWYPASIFFQGMKFIFLGDPSMPVVWRKEPK